jgi:hypothetical protein
MKSVCGNNHQPVAFYGTGPDQCPVCYLKTRISNLKIAAEAREKCLVESHAIEWAGQVDRITALQLERDMLKEDLSAAHFVIRSSQVLDSIVSAAGRIR